MKKIYIWTRGEGVPSGVIAEFSSLVDAEIAIVALEKFNQGLQTAVVRVVRLYNERES